MVIWVTIANVNKSSCSILISLIRNAQGIFVIFSFLYLEMVMCENARRSADTTCHPCHYQSHSHRDSSHFDVVCYYIYMFFMPYYTTAGTWFTVQGSCEHTVKIIQTPNRLECLNVWALFDNTWWTDQQHSTMAMSIE